MKTLLLTILICLIPLITFAQEEPEIPPGMEVIQDGMIEVIIPKDSKRRKVGNLIVVETSEAYLSRGIDDMLKCQAFQKGYVL